MALKIEEFDINYITAVGGKSVNGLKFANFRCKNSDKFPQIIVYGGTRVEQGKFGNYLELDIKDDKTEEFFYPISPGGGGGGFPPGRLSLITPKRHEISK